MSNENPKRTINYNDRQPDRKKLPTKFDHEFANEPLTANEKLNNKKTKKRQ